MLFHERLLNTRDILFDVTLHTNIQCPDIKNLSAVKVCLEPQADLEIVLIYVVPFVILVRPSKFGPNIAYTQASRPQGKSQHESSCQSPASLL